MYALFEAAYVKSMLITTVSMYANELRWCDYICEVLILFIDIVQALTAKK